MEFYKIMKRGDSSFATRQLEFGRLYVEVSFVRSVPCVCGGPPVYILLDQLLVHVGAYSS